jgi:hypothetical protein
MSKQETIEEELLIVEAAIEWHYRKIDDALSVLEADRHIECLEQLQKRRSELRRMR